MHKEVQADNPKVTIIMPSLNVEPFIEECLNSVVNQTLKEIEILCIDAGSTDGTMEIIREFEKVDSRVKYVASEKKSHGYQCNVGMKMARGKYIGFVETDDFADSDMFRALYEMAEEYDLDCVKSDHYGFVDVKPGTRYQEIKKIFPGKNEQARYGVPFSPHDHTDVLRRDSNMWNGIYRRAFIEKYRVRLNETPGAAYQDMGFVFQTICQAKRMMYIDRGLYHYRRDNMNSSVRASDGLEKIWREFGYCKEFLNRGGVELEKWRGEYYYKLSGMSISNRVAAIMLNNNSLSENARQILEEIQKEMKEGFQKGIIQADSFSFERMMEINLLINSIEAYSEYTGSCRRVKEEYQRYMISKAKGKRMVVIFGCAKAGKRLCALLYRSGEVKNIVFCDNNTLIQGTELLGCKVVSPEDVISKEDDHMFFITGTGSATEMYKQLTASGVPGNNILYYNCTGIEI